MIARTPEQESLYQARLKFQREAAARLEQARAAGRAEGEQIGQVRGEQIGQARLLEQLLGLPATPSETLAKFKALKDSNVQRQLTLNALSLAWAFPLCHIAASRSIRWT